ncbi:MAG: dTDP-4-dehydrorhamnose reductase [Bacteroidota bacterium]|jgi:dTDP-4-dehydrorhamnose reductase
MRIAVIGKSGQLARSLAYVADGQNELAFFGKEELDLLDEKRLYEKLSTARCEVVINCAAYTAVDLAEDEPEAAYALNVTAVERIVSVCERLNTFLIHVSTDYVFDGKGVAPYKEDDATNPQSVYGSTKRKGEEVLLSSGVPCIIARTSWLYSPFGKNFYKTIRQRLETNQQLKVVNDQRGVPTSALDLARALLYLAANHEEVLKPEVIHISNTGATTWYDFAAAIAEGLGVEYDITPVDSSAFVSKAKRPAYSVLSTEKLADQFGYLMRPWKEGLEEVLSIPIQD